MSWRTAPVCANAGLALYLDEYGQPELAADYWQAAESPIRFAMKQTRGSRARWSHGAAEWLYAELLLFKCRNGINQEGDLEKALKLAESIAFGPDGENNVSGDDHFFTLTLAAAYVQHGDNEKALAQYRIASEAAWKLKLFGGSEELRLALTVDRFHHRLLKNLRRTSALESAIRASIDRRIRTLPPNHPQRAYMRQELARVLRASAN